MGEVVIVHSGERDGLLAAALLRGHLGRGRVELQRPETLLRFLRHQAGQTFPAELYVLGLNLRGKDTERLGEALEALAKRGHPACWISHKDLSSEGAAAVAAHCRTESGIDPARSESVSLVRDRFALTGPQVTALVHAAAQPAVAERDPKVRPWLLVLDLAEANHSRHPGYLQSLVTRLSEGFPAELNPIDTALYRERETAVKRSRERAQGFVRREVVIGDRHLALADLRGERTSDWRLVAEALVGGTAPLADVALLLAVDGSIKLATGDGLRATELILGDTTGRFPQFLPAGVDGMVTTRPGVAGFVAHEDKAEVETVLSRVITRLGGTPDVAPAPVASVAPVASGAASPPDAPVVEAVEPAVRLVAVEAPVEVEPLPADDGPDAALASVFAEARGAGKAVRLVPLVDVSAYAPVPADLVGRTRLFRVRHVSGTTERDGIALAIEGDEVPLGGGVLEEALQCVFETAAEQGLGHVYLKTPDGRYGAAELLHGRGVTLVAPATPQAAPVPWDGGHYKELALREDWEDAPGFADCVRLVRVDPNMELSLEHSALRVCYRGVRVLELRRRGKSILGPDREGIEFATRRFRRVSPAELSQVARIKSAIDDALDERGPKRARVVEITSKILTETRSSDEAGYWIVARDVTFPEARHLRLHLLAVNKRTHRLTAMHVAVPGTMSFPHWPLRALRLASWLQGPRLRTLAADAEKVLAQKAALGLPGYEAVRVEAGAPIETLLVVPRGERVASDEFETRFRRVVSRLDPPGGLQAHDLIDWTTTSSVIRSSEAAPTAARATA